MVITINDQIHWLWCVVDLFSMVLEVLVQSRRDQYAARKLIRKLLGKYGVTPQVLITDEV